jgi:hypothetical protein
MSMSLKKKVRELTGDDASQSAKIAALESAVGSKDTDAGSLKKRCKDIETAIGDDETADSIKGRLYALEHPANGDG